MSRSDEALRNLHGGLCKVEEQLADISGTLDALTKANEMLAERMAEYIKAAQTLANGVVEVLAAFNRWVDSEAGMKSDIRRRLSKLEEAKASG